jgi:acid phosphatase (class A)
MKKVKNKLSGALGLVLASLIIVPAYAQEKVDNKPFYVGADIIKPTLLVAPLTPDSREFKDTMSVIKQNHMTLPPKRLQEATEQINLSPAVFSQVLGESFNKKKLPVTFALLERLGSDMNGLVTAGKNYWKAPYPYKVDTTIKPAFEDTDQYCYPSRHTALTRLWAHVLAEMVPGKYGALIERAHKIAWNRVAVGLAFGYDLRGGDHLTYLMMGALQTNEQYRKDLAAAKAEMEKTGLTK